MKNLKLKAFNEGDKKLVDVINISFFDDEILVGYKVYSGEQRSLKNPKIVQSIGLIDKNGKEIYEGFVYLADFNSDADLVIEIVGVVVMHEFTWCLKCSNGEIYSINKLSNFEHIGDIYENPELNEDFEH